MSLHSLLPHLRHVTQSLCPSSLSSLADKACRYVSLCHSFIPLSFPYREVNLRSRILIYNNQLFPPFQGRHAINSALFQGPERGGRARRCKTRTKRGELTAHDIQLHFHLRQIDAAVAMVSTTLLLRALSARVCSQWNFCANVVGLAFTLFALLVCSARCDRALCMSLHPLHMHGTPHNRIEL